MDWAQQLEQMSQQWAESQRIFMSTWAGARPGGANPNSAQWRQMIDTWRLAMQQMLDMQAEGVRLWAAGVNSSGAPAAMQQWANGLQQMTGQWISYQRQGWEGWFRLLESLDPNRTNRTGAFDPQSMARFWQEMVQQTMNSQQQWFQFWSAGQPDKTNF